MLQNFKASAGRRGDGRAAIQRGKRNRAGVESKEIKLGYLRGRDAAD